MHRRSFPALLVAALTLMAPSFAVAADAPTTVVGKASGGDNNEGELRKKLDKTVRDNAQAQCVDKSGAPGTLSGVKVDLQVRSNGHYVEPAYRGWAKATGTCTLGAPAADAASPMPQATK